MITPLFNYCTNLLDQVQQAGILFSDESVLKLNCIKDKRTAEQRRALENFESWKGLFINNCNGMFYSGSAAMINEHENSYQTDLVSAMLIAELYDWSRFKSLEDVNVQSIFAWDEAGLQKTRLFSNLV